MYKANFTASSFQPYPFYLLQTQNVNFFHLTDAQPIQLEQDKSNFPKNQRVQARTGLEPATPLKVVPRGLVTLEQMVAILSNHARDPVTWDAVNIAEKMNVRESDVAGLLKNFELLGPGDFQIKQTKYDDNDDDRSIMT